MFIENSKLNALDYAILSFDYVSGNSLFFCRQIIAFFDIILVKPQILQRVFCIVDVEGGRPVIPVVLKFRLRGKQTPDRDLLAVGHQTQRNLLRAKAVPVRPVLPDDVYGDFSSLPAGEGDDMFILI